MDPYVVASLSGNKRNKKKRRTPVHKDGSTSPRWGHALAAFTLDEAAARAGRLTLKFKIKAKRTLGRDKDVGRADVPVKELLEQGRAGGDGMPKAMSYSVRLPSGKTKGVLEFSYKFGEQFTVAAPPAAKKAGKPVMAYLAAAAPPASSSAAVYLPPPMHRAAPYPPLAGYPPQGYWYPPKAVPRYSYPLQRYGYAAPPPAYQQPPKKHGGGAGALGLGLVGGLFDGLLIGDMISDC